MFQRACPLRVRKFANSLSCTRLALQRKGKFNWLSKQLTIERVKAEWDVFFDDRREVEVSRGVTKTAVPKGFKGRRRRRDLFAIRRKSTLGRKSPRGR